MDKQELKEQLKAFKDTNEVLTIKIAFLVLWDEDYIKAREVENIDRDVIFQEIEQFKEELLQTRIALHDHYFHNNK